VPVDQRKLLIQHCQSLESELIPDQKQLQLPPDDSPPLWFLPVRDGFSCSYSRCRHRTTCKKKRRVHVNKAHGLQGWACTRSYRPAWLQSWFRGSRAQYWVVAVDAPHIPIPKAVQSRNALEKLEQQEIQRLEQLECDYMAQERLPEDPETNSWLRWTQWHTQFAGLSLEIITRSAVVPQWLPDSDYALRTWAGETFLSPVADEIKLFRLAGC
jgi:Orsellinic acid/F9775 biosynthesis cluster protein D